MMKKSRITDVLTIVYVAMGIAGLTLPANAGWKAPYTADANTLHLWHFDEAHPGPAVDTGNGATFSVSPQNSASLGSAADTSGGANAALRSSASIPIADVTGTGGKFTIEALIRTTALSGVQIITAMDNDFDERLYHFRLNGGALEFLNINGGDLSPTATIPSTGPDAFVANEWFHVAVTYDGNEGDANNMKFYWTRVDAAVTAANLIGQTSMAADLLGSTVFAVGNISVDHGDQNIEGRIDEVRISDMVRAPADMIGWGTPYTADANTLHLWHFDEDDPGPAADTGNGTTFSLSPQDSATLGSGAYAAFGTPADTSGGANSAFRSSASIPIADVTGTGGKFTIEALIRTTALSGVQIITAMDNDFDERLYHFRLNGGALEFLNINGGDLSPTATIPSTGPDAFVANEWFHVAVTYDGNEGDANNMKFYWTRVDAAVTAANLIGQTSMAADLLGSTVFAIGNISVDHGDQNIEGLIDEVRISDIARTPADMIGAPPRGTVISIL